VPLSSLSSPARRLAALALLPLVGTAALVAAAPTAQAVDISSPVVISEVYGGGGNSGAPFTNDFIELYNSGTTPINLSGWSVQYGSATNLTTWSGVTPLSGSIAPGAYFMVQEASGGSIGSPLPSADVTGSINLSATNGKVALV
jgi:predicted extracellular nuclease